MTILYIENKLKRQLEYDIPYNIKRLIDHAILKNYQIVIWRDNTLYSLIEKYLVSQNYYNVNVLCEGVYKYIKVHPEFNYTNVLRIVH